MFGIDGRGDLVTYWWSPESGANRSGLLGNGWQLSNISSVSNWSRPSDEPSRLSGQTSVRLGRSTSPEILEVKVASGSQNYMFWFDPTDPGPCSTPWRARAGA